MANWPIAGTPATSPVATLVRPHGRRGVPWSAVAAAACLATAHVPAGSAETPVTLAIRAGRIETAAGDPVENGVILVSGGRIQAVGADVAVPEGADVLDAAGGVVVPGFVHAATSLGCSGTSADKPASNPQYSMAEELYPFQDVYKRAAQAGFTTLHLTNGAPGIAGQGALVSTRTDSVESMLLSDRGPLLISFRADTETQNAIRGALEAASKDPSPGPETAPLKWAVEGEIPTIVFCPRPGDILYVLKLVEPYKSMRPAVVCLSDDLYLMAEQLAQAKVPVVVPARIAFERFTRNRINIPRVLDEAGVKVVCTTSHSGLEAFAGFRAGMAELVRGGLSRAAALRACTRHPAEVLGLDYRLGTIEPGKDANLVVLDGDVFDLRATVRRVLVEGQTVYDSGWGGIR